MHNIINFDEIIPYREYVERLINHAVLLIETVNLPIRIDI